MTLHPDVQGDYLTKCQNTNRYVTLQSKICGPISEIVIFKWWSNESDPDCYQSTAWWRCNRRFCWSNRHNHYCSKDPINIAMSFETLTYLWMDHRTRYTVKTEMLHTSFTLRFYCKCGKVALTGRTRFMPQLLCIYLAQLSTDHRSMVLSNCE